MFTSIHNVSKDSVVPVKGMSILRCLKKYLFAKVNLKSRRRNIHVRKEEEELICVCVLLQLKTGVDKAKNVNKQSPLVKLLLFVLQSPLTESTKLPKVLWGVQFSSVSCTNEAADSLNR